MKVQDISLYLHLLAVNVTKIQYKPITKSCIPITNIITYCKWCSSQPVVQSTGGNRTRYLAVLYTNTNKLDGTRH
jgi:hypothetical protein